MKGTELIILEDGSIHLPKELYVQDGVNYYTTVKEKCMHVIGLLAPPKGSVYRRNGKKYYKAYRNIYGAHEAQFDILAEKGYMTASPSKNTPEQGNYWYTFTDAGLLWMAKELGFAEIKVSK